MFFYLLDYSSKGNSGNIFPFLQFIIFNEFFSKGNPLMAKDLENDFGPYYVAGINSYGPFECGKESIPGVFTKVASYLEWIVDTIHPWEHGKNSSAERFFTFNSHNLFLSFFEQSKNNILTLFLLIDHVTWPIQMSTSFILKIKLKLWSSLFLIHFDSIQGIFLYNSV